MPPSDIPMVRVAVEDLRRFTRDAFAAMGLDAEAADLSAHAILYSELRFIRGRGRVCAGCQPMPTGSPPA